MDAFFVYYFSFWDAGISPNLYEAAEVDGASEWGLIRYITIPMLKPIMYIGILIRSIDSLKCLTWCIF